MDSRWTQFSTWADNLNEHVDTQGAAMHKEMDAVYTRIDDVEKYVSE
jgi:hypothetical protein